jgi:uncharacterized membrane protein YkoI
MRYLVAVAIFAASLMGNAWVGNVWGASEKQKALEATLSMEDAIRIAVQSQPGSKPYEVEMETENGRTTYRVQLVDTDKKKYKVYVDAHDGKIVAKK